MTREEAIAKAETKWWEKATAQEIVAFQLYERLLCMPFGEYHKAVESVLGRPVWTHEFAKDELLKAEFEGKRNKPGMDEIIGQLPPEKTIILERD